MAGRFSNKLKGGVTIWYGLVLLMGLLAGIATFIYWIYDMTTGEANINWGIFVLITFLVTIIGLAVFFLPRFRAKREK